VRICFFGDSYVNGTGDPEFLGWVGRVCQGRDVTCYNVGVRRDTSRDVLRRWQTEASCRLPDGIDGRLVFSFGVNDCVVEGCHRRVPFEESLENTRAILATAGWPILLIGPPPTAEAELNTRVAELSQTLSGVCSAIGIPYLPVFDALSESQTWMDEVAKGDGAHPSAAGYAAMARIVGDWSSWQSWFA
jgi:lysophospholipase L1-like esterase